MQLCFNYESKTATILCRTVSLFNIIYVQVVVAGNMIFNQIVVNVAIFR